MSSARGRPRPYAGSRFNDPEWAQDPARPPPGFPPLADDDPDEQGTPAAGSAPRRAAPAAAPARAQSHPPAAPKKAAPAPAPGRPSTSGGSSISSVGVDDGAGLLLGLFAYALAHAYLVGGPAGAKAWLAAKFLNRTSPAGTYAATTHPDYPVNPGSDGPAPTYPAGPWQQTAPIPGGVLR